MADTTALKNRIRAAIKANDNQEITGPVLQQTLLDIVDELDLNPELQEAINTEKEARQTADTQLGNLITGIKNNVDNGYVYAGIATPSIVPVSGKVFYVAIQAGTYTNFHFNGGDDPIVLTKDGIYFIVSGSDDDDWNAEPMLQLDDVPTASSNNAVKSGSVAEELALGAVYDVSAKNPTAGPNSDGKWESLSALLSDANINTLIPTSVRKGGMSIKFIQSDNRYVRYRLISDSFNTDASNWIGDNADTDILNIILTNTDSAIKTINEGDYNEGLWLSSDNSFYSIDTFNGIFIPCEQYKQFILTPSVDNVIAFLKSKPTAAGDVADYASGSSRTSILRTTTIEVPIDAKYLYIDTKYDGAPLPCTIQGYYKKGVVKIVDELSTDNEKTHSLINEKIYNNVDILGYETSLWLSADNSFYAVVDSYKGAFIPCVGNRLIEMTPQSEEIASFAFLTEKPSSAGEVAQYADGSFRNYLPFKGRTPYNTKYIYISTKSENVCSSTIKICNVNDNIAYNNPESSPSNTYADMNNYISNKCISDGDVLNFIFFSDPHTLGISNDFNQSEFDKYLLPIKDLYNKEMVDFVLCGGDWLNAYDTQEIAAKKLLYLNKTINDLFERFYNMVGNHDTNYRGYINSESQTFDGIFSNKTIRNLLFNDKKNCYYSFEFGNTKCYVLDTGTDAVRSILSYEKEQLDWLASELHNNNNKHVLIAFHIYSNAETSSQWNNLITDFGQAIMNMALAFNSKTTVVIDGDTYDFTSASGTIACFLCGHTHFDYIDETTNVPVICIADERNGNIPTYDLVSLDFGAAKAYMKRYGSGQNREVNIVV